MQPTKRKFIPSFDTVFGDSKRFKTDCGAEGLSEPPSYPIDWNSRLNLHSELLSSIPQREALINSYNLPNTNRFHPPEPKPIQQPRVILKAKINKKPHPSTESSLEYPSNCSFTSQAYPRNVGNRSRSMFELPLPHKSQKAPTVPEPFNLSFERDKTRSFITQNSGNEFVAREMPDFSIPFYPKPSSKPITRPGNVMLSTGIRADRRELFNEGIRKKERDLENIRRIENDERVRREEEEIKMIRKHMEFKAMPYNPGNPFLIKPALGKHTVPNPPQLMTESRAFYRNN